MSHDQPPRLAIKDSETGRGPLEAIRVIELGSVVAGPFAGRILADYGADVIKVEAPDRPDPMRTWGQASYRGHRLWWTIHARNKRCVTLDLRSERGQEMLLELVEVADVVIENFRPGTLERWNLGWEHLRQRNPGLVLARVSGFGQTGPHATRPGYASAAEAVGGLRFINGHPGEAPPRMAVSLGDSLGGLFAAQGILAALLHRDRTGHGQVVDVALTEACLALTESIIPEFDKLGRIRRPGGTRLEGIAPSNLFRTSDERWIIVAANQDTVFRRLCGAMGAPELAVDPRFIDHESRGEHQDAIEAIVADWVADRPAAEATAALESAGVVVGAIHDAADIVKDPQFLARNALVQHFDERIGEDVLGPAVVPVFSRTPGAVRWAGPAAPGTHNEEVFRELLNLKAEDLAQLAADGVL
jgi:formyl-CoA transferase